MSRYEKELSLLPAQIQLLRKASKWLAHSYEKCVTFGIKETYSVEELESLEALTSRFSRAIDLLVNRVYRTIDYIETMETGTIIDVMNRAHKRQLVDSVIALREIKELRNQMVHEYPDDKIIDLFKDSFLHTPKLLEFINNTIAYCEKNYSC